MGGVGVTMMDAVEKWDINAIDKGVSTFTMRWEGGRREDGRGASETVRTGGSSGGS